MSKQRDFDFSRGRLMGLIDLAQFPGRRAAAVKALLRALVWFVKNDRQGVCRPKLDLIAWRMGVHRSTAQRAVRAAQELGVLHVKESSFFGGQQANQYRIDEGAVAAYVPARGQDALARGQDARAYKEYTSDKEPQRKPQRETPPGNERYGSGVISADDLTVPPTMRAEIVRPALTRFIEHQQSLGKTPRTAELAAVLREFADVFPTAPDQEFAAGVELMISKGWSWCKADWCKNAKGKHANRTHAAPGPGVVFDPDFEPGPL
ncbi:MAG TPA: hypothetical protein VMV69_26935 [Pirellulales bacterium]|nr:hypothetical protein [Pirellulales bacterium]